MTSPRASAALAAVTALALAAVAHGAPDAVAQGDAAAVAAEMAALYGMALEDDEMRSHLPDRLQMQMGKRPFMYEHTYHCWGPCFRDAKQRFEGLWDHEAYLRSIGADLGAVCARAYYDFVSRVGWLRDGAYWGDYLYQCHGYHSDYVNRDFAPLLEDISRECEMRITEGWFVVAGGEFHRHGGPMEGDPLLNKTTRITPAVSAGATPGPIFPLFARACLEGVSAVKTALSSGGFNHYTISDRPYALPPEYAPKDTLGDWAETPEAREARELGSRLAELYEAALGSAEVRSRLPREMQDALSLDVPETYYVLDAWVVVVPGSSNKYHPLTHILPDIFPPSGVWASDQDPQFCSHRPDLRVICG